MENGSKLIQCRFILFLGYYFDILLTTKISKVQFPKSIDEWKNKLLLFEETIVEQISQEHGKEWWGKIKLYTDDRVLQDVIKACKTTNELNSYCYLIFLCTCWFSKTALAYQAIDTLRSIISDKNLMSYLTKILPSVVEILIQTELTFLSKHEDENILHSAKNWWRNWRRNCSI